MRDSVDYTARMIDQPVLAVVLAVVVGYALGGVDFAVWVAKAKGVDIYAVGSGNPGTSNVLRTLGRGPAALVLIGDLAKGLIASGVGFVLVGVGGLLTAQGTAALAGFAAVVGHCYPALHGFKGGKGVATGMGVILFANPLVGLGLGVVWGIVVGITRTASLGSLLVVLLTLPALYLANADGSTLLWVGAALMLIVYRHKGNIGRLLAKTEESVAS